MLSQREPAVRRRPWIGLSWSERWFGVFLIVSHVYYFHRWVFSYNDISTSPTYRATPLVWQVAKYPLVGVIAGACALSLLTDCRRRFVARPTGGFALAIAGLLVYYFAETVWSLTHSYEGFTLARSWFFLPIILLIPFFYRSSDSLETYFRVGALLVIYHVAFSAVQMFEYYTADRLPGLAYMHGLVRFGGGLDDPNGFAVWLILPILIMLTGWPESHSRPRRVATGGILIALLFTTFSYSGFAALLVGAAAYAVIGRQLGKAALFAFASLAAVTYLATSPFFAKIIIFKSRSALSRFNADPAIVDPSHTITAFLDKAGWQELLLGSPSGGFHSETSYILTFMHFGIVGVSILLVLVATTIFRGLVRVRDLNSSGENRDALLFAALTAYEIAFVVAALGVPFFDVFPVNVTFWVVAMILWLPFVVQEEAAARKPAGLWAPSTTE